MTLKQFQKIIFGRELAFPAFPKTSGQLAFPAALHPRYAHYACPVSMRIYIHSWPPLARV